MSVFGETKIENSFVKVCKPLFFSLSATGCARVIITNDSVSPRLWYQKVYSCVNLALCSAGVIYLTNRSAFYEIDNEWTILSTLCYVQIVTNLLLTGCPIIINNFFNIVSNCNLISKLEDIDRSLRITANECHYNHLYKVNCFFVLFVFVYQGLWNFLVVFLNSGARDLLLTFPALLTLTAQDLELSFFLSILIFLNLRIKYINNMLDRSIEIKWKSLKHLESSNILRRLFGTYRHVLAAYSLTEKTFSIFILLLVVHMFVNELLALERFIVQGKNMSQLTFYQTLVVIIKMHNRMLMMGVQVRRLEQQFENTKISCLRIITNSDGESRRQAKNILRLVSLVRRMNIFNMFTVGSVPVQLVALLATYAVVLLQLSYSSQSYDPTSVTYPR